eukprot:1178082-Prorocentrum_minimum.AAC.2
MSVSTLLNWCTQYRPLRARRGDVERVRRGCGGDAEGVRRGCGGGAEGVELMNVSALLNWCTRHLLLRVYPYDVIKLLRSGVLCASLPLLALGPRRALRGH